MMLMLACRCAARVAIVRSGLRVPEILQGITSSSGGLAPQLADRRSVSRLGTGLVRPTRGHKS